MKTKEALQLAIDDHKAYARPSEDYDFTDTIRRAIDALTALDQCVDALLAIVEHCPNCYDANCTNTKHSKARAALDAAKKAKADDH